MGMSTGLTPAQKAMLKLAANQNQDIVATPDHAVSKVSNAGMSTGLTPAQMAMLKMGGTFETSTDNSSTNANTSTATVMTGLTQAQKTALKITAKLESRKHRPWFKKSTRAMSSALSGAGKYMLRLVRGKAPAKPCTLSQAQKAILRAGRSSKATNGTGPRSPRPLRDEKAYTDLSKWHPNAKRNAHLKRLAINGFR